QSLADPIVRPREAGVLAMTDERQPVCDVQEIPGFAGGRERDVDEMHVVFRRFPRTSFNQVRRDGQRGATQLGPQSESLCPGKVLRGFVDADDEIVGETEDFKLPGITAHGLPPGSPRATDMPCSSGEWRAVRWRVTAKCVREGQTAGSVPDRPNAQGRKPKAGRPNAAGPKAQGPESRAAAEG